MTYEVLNLTLGTVARTTDLYEAMDWYTGLVTGELSVIQGRTQEVLFAK